MRDLEDKKHRPVKDKKPAKQSVQPQETNLNEKDKQAAEFLKKHPIPAKFLPR